MNQYQRTYFGGCPNCGKSHLKLSDYHNCWQTVEIVGNDIVPTGSFIWNPFRSKEELEKSIKPVVLDLGLVAGDSRNTCPMFTHEVQKQAEKAQMELNRLLTLLSQK